MAQAAAGYESRVSLHRNVGQIMVTCRLCGRDIGTDDYMALEGARLQGVTRFFLLFHESCAARLCDDLDTALHRGATERNQTGYFVVSVFGDVLPWLAREAQTRGCLKADVVDDAANEELRRRMEAAEETHVHDTTGAGTSGETRPAFGGNATGPVHGGGAGLDSVLDKEATNGD